MADTAVQRQVADWIRREWLPSQFNQRFTKDAVPLVPGGTFEAGAVSLDKTVVACISTSGLATSSGKHGSGKTHKIRSDIYFLLLTPPDCKRIMVFTEKDMFEFWVKEKRNGRVPKDIQFMIAPVPGELRQELHLAKERSSKEVGG